MGVIQLDMTSPRWSVSTATRWDTLQGNAEDLETKITGTGIKTALEGLSGFVSYNVVPSPPTGLFSPLNLYLSYSGLEEFKQPEFEGYGPKTSKSVSEDISNEVRESPEAPLVKELVSDDNLEKKTVSPTVAKIEFVRPKQQEKPVRKSGTDKAKIQRKRLKPGKHEHKNGRAHKNPGGSYQSQKVKASVKTIGQALGQLQSTQVTNR
ncbi:hypothetical protein Tco_0379619 [Tanacetum coccineum]